VASSDWWVRIRIGLRDEPEVLALAHALERRPNEVVGMLVAFWGWAKRVTKNGLVPGVTDPRVTERFIDALVGVTGFAQALQTVGWLSVTPEGVVVPRFEKHLGTQVERQRELTRVRVRRHRLKKCNDPCNVTSNACNALEKRREENNPPKPPSTSQRGRAVDSLDPLFDRFWRAYPNQVARQPAARVWDELNVEESLLTTMLAALERQKKTEQWQLRKIPRPDNWLADARWEDALPPDPHTEQRTSDADILKRREETRRKKEQARRGGGLTLIGGGLPPPPDQGGESCPS